MKRILYLILVVSFNINSQTSALNRITDAGNGIYFMYYDSSNSKSTIVEFEDFIVLIEAPVKDQGGNATDLRDHSAGGEKILRTLNDQFPGKPLRYFPHSHWHPHSVSTINPFLSAGVKVVSTELNYSVIRKFVDTAGIKDYMENLVFISDSLEIRDNKNRIVVHRFTKKDFPNAPTDDYLFFYLPKQNIMHCACMYSKWEGEPVDGKEMLTGREEYLHRFMQNKGIKPEYLIRLSKEKKEANDMQPFGGLENVILNGIKGSDILKDLLAIDQKTLEDHPEVILQDIIRKKIPSSIVNSAVYNLLRKKELIKALSFAKL